ncbi:MAG: hypothetical protein JWM85_123 [Acidimicrobiaceae bacterium]|nr:hypothetical protein [Acidimicrobiaceae bacterium]
MSSLTDAARTLVPARGDPSGPLPPLLVGMTVVTGLVDAFSYLTLGHVFVANMTGNVVFLAFAIAGAPGFSIASSLVAFAGFAAGSALGGRFAVVFGRHRGRLLGVTATVQLLVLAAAVGVSASTAGHIIVNGDRYALIALLGAAMGLQNAAARKLAVPDLTTTVLTLTTTGIFADMRALGGPGSKVGRRLVSILAMFAGACVGAVILVHASKTVVLVIAAALLLVIAAFTTLASRGTPKWTEAK